MCNAKLSSENFDIKTVPHLNSNYSELFSAFSFILSGGFGRKNIGSHTIAEEKGKDRRSLGMYANGSLTGIATAFCLILAVSLLISPTTVLRPFLSQPLSKQTLTESSLKCPYPLVYNKPHKTASTYIQGLITNWSKETGRGNYVCAGQSLESAIYLPECIPHKSDGCGVVNCHLILSPETTGILDARMPDHRKITSTRYPPHRIISNFLQINQIRHDSVNETHNALRTYLSKKFNPWKLYNFHTGEDRVGSCPLKMSDRVMIYNMVTKFDFVVDANLVEESNTILRHNGLFTFPEVSNKVNFRGASGMKLPEDIQQLLRDVACVEFELHKALQMRMASLYEQATGKSCVKHGRPDKMSSCLADKEQIVLKENWLSS